MGFIYARQGGKVRKGLCRGEISTAFDTPVSIKQKMCMNVRHDGPLGITQLGDYRRAILHGTPGHDILDVLSQRCFLGINVDPMTL